MSRFTSFTNPVNGGVAFVKNNRPYNEDRYCVYGTSEDVWLYMVCDGHGGQDASTFVCNNLPRALLEAIQGILPSDQAAVEGAVRNCFLDMQGQMAVMNRSGDMLSSFKYQGTTAVVAIYFKVDGILMVANVGDSRCVLAKDAVAVALSEDHKPDLPRETARIKAMGGTVDVGSGVPRVRGLAVSRSLGDLATAVGDVYLVSPSPDITWQHVDKSCRYIILASDGLWDSLSSQEAVNIFETQKSVSGLVLEAVNKGSHDNITAIVAPLWFDFKHK